MPDNALLIFVISFLVTTSLYWGVWVPLSPRRHYAAALPAKTRDERIAELECETRMCEHAVGDEHPAKVWTRDGRAFWRLSDGRMWEVGTDAPDD